MQQREASSPKTEVLGEIVCSFVDTMKAFKGLAREILVANGIRDPKPYLWYRQESWRLSLNEIAERIGPNTLFQIARQIPSGAEIPPELDTLEKAFQSLDAAYQGTHRGGDVGHYRVVESAEKSLKVECTTPYPCDFDRGIVAGLAQRFEGDNPLLDVHHETDVRCKKQGAGSCVFSVHW